MAGYKREKKVYTLVFDDAEFEGLEIKTRSISLGKYLEMQTLIDSELNRENIDKLFGEFAGILLSWNLEDDDGPVPITVEGLYSQDLDFVKAIIDAWRDAMVGVHAPLPQSSPGGEPSPEASIPMEALSGNLAS
jgi:hypothetical protein